MRTLAIVPARAGSKGIPGKNFRDFCGQPLLEWAVRVGKQTCEAVVCSTDSGEYGTYADGLGAGVVFRPPELAADDAPMLKVIEHALWLPATEIASPDVVVLLQPTSPIRKPEHVREALRLLDETRADSAVSVVEIPAHYSPDYSCRIDEDGDLRPNVLNCEYGASFDVGPKRRQECEKAYSRDGTVYAIRRSTIEAGSLYGRRCVPLIIPPHESCNIDTEDDWQRAEAMMRARLNG